MTAEDTTQAGLANGTHVVLTSAYDAAGNRTLSALKIGSVYDAFTLSSFDSLNRVTTLQQFDLAQGLGASLIDGFSGDSHALDSKRVDYTYDANGQVIAEIRYAALDGSDPVAATYTRYDTMGHVTELDHILYDGTGAMEMTAYAYDAGGRMIRQTGSLGTSTYAYDGDSQLIGSDVAGPNGAESYTYDANGNRTTNGTSPSGVGANNQNAGVVSAMTGASLTFAYDGEGNQARMINVDNSSTTLYAYDHRNRMTSASEAGSYSASYTYDAFDRRIGKSVDYAVSADLGEHYLWDGNDLLAVLNDNGSVSQRYLMGPGQNQVLAEETVGDTTRWALTDTIGTVRTGVDNASGHAVLFNIALADSFGNSDQNLSGVGIRMGFTGYQYDKESGDYYAEARYYSPLQGKFTSEDPRGFEAGDPNLGRYVGNNPLTYTDPSGLEPDSGYTDADNYRNELTKLNKKQAAEQLQLDQQVNQIQEKLQKQIESFFDVLMKFSQGSEAHRVISDAVEQFARKNQEIVYRNKWISKTIEANEGDYSKVKEASDLAKRLEVQERLGMNIQIEMNDPVTGLSLKELHAFLDWYKYDNAKSKERLRPDLVIKEKDCSLLEVYEIKSTKEGAGAAMEDVNGYISIFKASGINAIPGNSKRDGVNNLVGVPTIFGILRWESPSPGVILYNYSGGTTQKEKEMIKALAGDLAKKEARMLQAAVKWAENANQKNPIPRTVGPTGNWLPSLDALGLLPGDKSDEVPMPPRGPGDMPRIPIRPYSRPVEPTLGPGIGGGYIPPRIEVLVD